MMASVRPLCGSHARRLVASRLISSSTIQKALLIPKGTLSSSNIKRFAALNQNRFLSTTVASAETASEVKVPKDKKDKPNKDNSNIFLDNLGTIFLLSIAGVVLALVRSSFGGSNRTKLRDQIEEDAALDPLEIDDLRVANCELTPDVFRTIMTKLSQDFPQGTAKYEDFVFSTRKTMRSLKGDAFTIEMGHLLDRVMEAALNHQEKTKDDEISIVFFLAALSLCMDMESSVSERIRVLYDVLALKDSTVTCKDVEKIVGYLQDTSQLTPDAQVVMSDTKYPLQQYKIASPEELVAWDGPPNDSIDIQAFADILRSKSVCAWGECYFKKKPTL